MTLEQRASLNNRAGWADSARQLLARLGFSLLDAEQPGEHAAHLLIALRPAPTLQHFDPEEVTYWVTEAGRGRPTRLDRESRLPLESAYAWGRITVSDRLGVSNQFLTFGGNLRASGASDGSVIADYGSEAPILRWSGHSQGLDPLTAEVGAFFGRVKVPIDFVPGVEQAVAEASPRALYCAFVQDIRARLARARSFRDANGWLNEFVAHEGQRLEAGSKDSWRAGDELRRQLRLTAASPPQ